MGSRLSHLECSRCGCRHDSERLQLRCECGGSLLARYDLDGLDLAAVRRRAPGAWRYRELLPVRGEPISLGEMQTPLVAAERLAQRWGVETFVKDDSGLPGGTFKARGSSVGLSRAVELGVKHVVMPSAGNAGGAWALYAARAGIDITVTMARSAPDTNKAEVVAAGGNLVEVDGTIADAGRIAASLAEESGAFLATTFSEPYRLEGKKSCWLELFDQCGDARSMCLPKTIVLPVGGGVAAVAAAKAAEEVLAAGWATGTPPRLIGVQPESCAPIARAFESGVDHVEPWGGPAMTIAAGLRVPAPAEGTLVLQTIKASGGALLTASESGIVAAVRTLASKEGIFACPEGAATVVAADRLAAAGDLDGPVVLYNTGSGAKYARALAEAGLGGTGGP